MALLYRSALIHAGFLFTGLFILIIFWIQIQKSQLRLQDLLNVSTISSKLQPATVTVDGLLEKNAHQFHTADEFKPHFKEVLKLPYTPIAQTKAACNWPEDAVVNFQYSTEDPWVVDLQDDRDLKARQKQWHEFIRDELLPYELYRDRFEGRGIVIVAGHVKSMKRAMVVLKALERLGSKLPVEIHFWDYEVSPEQQANVSAIYPRLHFNDLSGSWNFFKTDKDRMANYQLKTAAVVNSRFAEVLLLDSDNVPIIDPAELFESQTYKEYGTIFYPDIARTRPENPIWAITNTPCRMDEYEQESGQLLVDKRKFFYHLQLAAWFEHKHYEYYNTFLLGDKDMFRFAWHALKTKFGRPKKWLTSVGFVEEGYYCGHTFAQHHPDGRVAFMHGGLLKIVPREVLRWQRDTTGGVYHYYKRADSDEQPDVSVHVGIKWDGSEYLPSRYRTDDIRMGLCVDMYEVEPRPLDNIAPGYDSYFTELGGYWMIDEIGDIQ
ncbi:hypothetical protein DV738_g1355, partial [Chaetothyriales sp. CBS 135597]